MNEFVDVTHLGSTNREYMNCATGEFVVCSCPYPPLIYNDILSNLGYPKIQLQDCPVHGW